MNDIVHTGEGLVIGTDVTLVANTKELKNAATVIALATVSDRDLILGPVDGILFADTGGKDHLHYRRGILDEVTAKLMGQHKKAFVVGLETLFSAKHPARALGRALQDASLAATHGMPVVFVSLATQYQPTQHDLEATFRALGFSEEHVRKNNSTFQSWVSRARHRASEDYLGEGMRKTKGI